MRVCVADVEVFAFDWIIVVKDAANGAYGVYHNQPEAVRELFRRTDVIFGLFNGKRYDRFIIQAICRGASQEEIKSVNDFIIRGGNGWDHPFIRENKFWFHCFDLKDDMQLGLSLKAIEGHLNLSIEESGVSFDLPRPLTQKELEETVRYCKYDVDTTHKLLNIRKGYLQGKLSLGRLKGMEDCRAIAMTNPKLTAAFLNASKKEWKDEREYEPPDNLRREFIPEQVFDFFDRMKDLSVVNQELFKKKCAFQLEDCACVVGFGGVHGAVRGYEEKAGNGRVIRNYDVASLYPSLMIEYGYTSRNIPSPADYINVYNKRLAAKKSGDLQTSNTLKLVLNSTYGAMLNQYNNLYDPRMGRSVCISGQLFLLELAGQYLAKCRTLRLIQLNTDGVMVSLDEKELPLLSEINGEWQRRTRFQLEEDRIQRIIQKDVNNYIMIAESGKVKTKGGYLNYGIAPAGVFNINNNLIIVKQAVLRYFTEGVSPEETIGGCGDIFCFQTIAKAGSKYSEAFQLVGGEKRPVQRVNRVYATPDTRYGTLYKVKAKDGSIAKIENLPEHCMVDNGNCLSLQQIDKQYYVNLAKRRIDEFRGIKPQKIKKERNEKMAAAKESKNIYQKLLEARVAFLARNVQKSGLNRGLGFKYFTLDDIVPAATDIFREIGLVSLVNLNREKAEMTILDVENPSSSIVFESPAGDLEPNKGVNPLQAVGAAHTYLRRYLYMTALDICEDDMIDAAAGTGEEKNGEETSSKPKIPLSQAERKEVARTLANQSGAATELQVQQLKNAVQQLKTLNPSKEEELTQLEIKTNGFTEITREQCEKLLIRVSDMLAASEAKGA